MSYDVFISHATEDKATIANPLAKALIDQGLRVWIDEFALHIGDSLRRSIDKGLEEARFGVVILSPNFLRKEWPQRELDALVARETGEGQPVLLPVWHNVTAQDVARFSPILADRLAVSTEQGVGAVAKAIAEAVLIKEKGESQSVADRLESVVERLERLERAIPTARERPILEERREEPDDVFVVHGRDEAAREAVCRFLEKIGARPVVLSEQANRGRTVIEKFEDHSAVKFSVVLLTPDDVGGLRDSPDETSARARQNVILELGYFLGKLGRNRFCILNKGNVEIPSDILGVVWIEMDPAHGWRIALARELNQAGVRINLNRVLE
jgi:predicted nucleotide-binding protein